MIRFLSVVFGFFFLVLGILGFLPEYTPNNNLFGFFHICPAHNSLHLLTGIVAMYVGITNAQAAKTFFISFGLLYMLLAALGPYYGDQPIFGVIANNTADIWLHAAIGLVSLSLGLGCVSTNGSRRSR